jgi:hypothetical protein
MTNDGHPSILLESLERPLPDPGLADREPPGTDRADSGTVDLDNSEPPLALHRFLSQPPPLLNVLGGKG